MGLQKPAKLNNTTDRAGVYWHAHSLGPLYFNTFIISAQLIAAYCIVFFDVFICIIFKGYRNN